MLFQKSFAALLACLAGVAFAGPVDLSRYRWAVVGDSLSDPLHPQPNNAVVKYYHFLSRDTGIQVVYTNASFGHPNSRYNEEWIAPKFLEILSAALGARTARKPAALNID